MCIRDSDDMINLHFPVFNNWWKAPAVAEPVHEPVWDATSAWRLQGWSQDRKYRTASHCHGSAGGRLKIAAFMHDSIYERFVKTGTPEKQSNRGQVAEILTQYLLSTTSSTKG